MNIKETVWRGTSVAIYDAIGEAICDTILGDVHDAVWEAVGGITDDTFRDTVYNTAGKITNKDNWK